MKVGYNLFISVLGRSMTGNDPTNLTLTQLNFDSQAFLDAELEDYKLYKPVLFTNELFPEKPQLRLWNV